MKIMKKEEVIEQYIKSGLIIFEATLSGDYKTNNKEWKKIVRVFKMLEKDLVLAEDCLKDLLQNDIVVTRTYAASHCLALNILVQEAIETLESDASDEENGIFRVDARMTLKVWREQGYLRVYQ